MSNTTKIRLSALVALFFGVVLCQISVRAQGSRGTISGEVRDPNGAVISGANAKLTRAGTRQERTTQTNAEGIYQFLEVEPGRYEIVINAVGFSEARIKDIDLEPNRNIRLDASLNVGATTEEITVTASEELIDRETPTLGTTVDPRRVQGLPLNGRNVLNLALGQPGVTAVESGAFGAGLGIRVNGARGTENNITLDGANNNEVAVGGATGVTPRPDAVQEFRLLTSNYEAEFGRNTGSVITVVTRGGTNEFHGNLRLFYRPTFLSAARFFDQNDPTDPPLRNVGNCPADRALRTRDNCDYRRLFERKEFGGNIGGPIYLPRFGEGGPMVWRGQNRSFFFFDYEGRRQLVGNTRTVTNIPTTDERNGIFTRSANNLLLDPATGQPFPIISQSGNTVRQQIPRERFSPIGLYYLNFFPASPTGSASVGANEIQNFDIITARGDHLLTNSQNLNFTLNWFDREEVSPFAFGGSSVPGFGSTDLRKTLNLVARHTYTITPSFVNSLLLGYARNEQPSTNPVNRTTPAEIGFTANFTAQPAFAGPPRITLFDRNLILGNTIQGPQARVSENFQIQDSVSWATGDHRFKFGFDGTKYKQDQAFLFTNQGIFTFSGLFGGNTTGDDLADLLIGNSPIAAQFGSNGERDFRQMAGALFAQDTWRVRDNLTFSLGVRYEYNSPLTDKFNRVAYYRPGVVSQLLTSGQLRTLEGIPITVPAGRRAPNGLVYPGDPDPVLGGTVPNGGVEKDWNNFAPRVGFAWTPGTSEGMLRKLLGDRETVIRGGFGVFYGAIIGDTALQQLTAPGFNGTNSFFFPASGTLADPFAPDPFPNFAGNQGQITNPFASSQFFVFAPLSQFSRAVDPNIRTPYTYQYNLTIERAFLGNYVASVAYVGNRGKKLYALEQNNPSLGTFIPFAETDPRRTIVPTPSNVNSRRANDDVRLGISQMVSAGRSWYDSLQAQVQRRYENGLLFQVAYTFSKSLTDADTLRNNLDLLDRDFGKSLSNEDAPHRFVASFIYDLPFFRNASGFTRTLLGGWSVGGIYTAQSGTPFTVNNLFDTHGTGGAILSFADLGAPYQTLDPRENNDRAFNANAFMAFGSSSGFPQLRRGTSGPNQFRLKNGINNFDAILAKTTRLTEGTSLELRFEAFNAFNHTQFGPGINTVGFPTGVDLNLNSPNFGKFVDARESRVIQLGARFQF